MEKEYKDPRMLPQVIDELSKTHENDLNIIAMFTPELVDVINIQKDDDCDSELFVITTINADCDGDFSRTFSCLRINELIQIRDYINQLIK